MTAFSAKDFSSDFDLISFTNKILESGVDPSTLLYELQCLGEQVSSEIDYKIKSCKISLDTSLLNLSGDFSIHPCFKDLNRLHLLKDNMVKTKESLKEAENWGSLSMEMGMLYLTARNYVSNARIRKGRQKTRRSSAISPFACKLSRFRRT